MADLGGHLAVSYLARHVFTDALDAVWRTNWEDASGAAQWSADTPAGALQADGGVSLNKPEIQFREASNDIEVHLSGACRFELVLDGTAVGGVYADIDAKVAVPVKISQEDLSLIKKAVVDLTGVTLEAAHLQLTWFDGPHHANAQSGFLSLQARSALTREFVKRASNYLTFHLPTDKLFAAELMVMTKGNPGSVIITPFVKLGGVRILDEWFAVGIDATSSIGQTQGDASAIGPPPDVPPPGVAAMPQAGPGDASARLIVDGPTAILYLQANAQLALRMAAATRPSLHPDTNSVRISLQEDTIVLTAIGSVDAPDPFPGQIPFSAEIRMRPFIPGNTRTIYASVKPKIRADTPFFLKVLGAIVDFFGGDSFAQLRRANKSEMAILFGVKIDQKVPNMFGLRARLEGRQISIRPDFIGLFGEAEVSTAFSEPDLDPTPVIFHGVGIRDRILQLRLASSRLIVDPTFRIRYEIKRGSSGVVIASGTAWSGTEGPFSDPIDLWDDANVLETFYIADLSVERPPGTVVAQSTQSVNVIDPFDRSRPFVRWRKSHFYTPTAEGHGPQPVTILSAVHRTAIRERCKFCDVREGRFGTPYIMQALDELPAAEEEGFSTRLCQYCFPEQ